MKPVPVLQKKIPKKKWKNETTNNKFYFLGIPKTNIKINFKP
jgi:hypothetical protein